MAADRWLLLSVRVPAADMRPLVGEALIEISGAAVQEEAGWIYAWLPSGGGSPESYVQRIRAVLLREVPSGSVSRISWRWQEDQDWAEAWKRGLEPRKVSRRLVVKPTWTSWEASENETVIDIDPKMAFGTGEHPTTRGCLRLMDAHIRPGDRVLDVGSGSGILSIAAVRLGARGATAVEDDPAAVENARENLRRNGVEERVRLIETKADRAFLGRLGGFDLVMANILSGVIIGLLPSLSRAISDVPDGRLILSGVLAYETDLIHDAARELRLRIRDEDREEEWWTGLLTPA